MFFTFSVAEMMNKCFSKKTKKKVNCAIQLVNFYVSRYEMSPGAEQVERMH